MAKNINGRNATEGEKIEVSDGSRAGAGETAPIDLLLADEIGDEDATEIPIASEGAQENLYQHILDEAEATYVEIVHSLNKIDSLFIKLDGVLNLTQPPRKSGKLRIRWVALHGEKKLKLGRWVIPGVERTRRTTFKKNFDRFDKPIDALKRAATTQGKENKTEHVDFKRWRFWLIPTDKMARTVRSSGEFSVCYEETKRLAVLARDLDLTRSKLRAALGHFKKSISNIFVHYLPRLDAIDKEIDQIRLAADGKFKEWKTTKEQRINDIKKKHEETLKGQINALFDEKD